MVCQLRARVWGGACLSLSRTKLAPLISCSDMQFFEPKMLTLDEPYANAFSNSVQFFHLSHLSGAQRGTVLRLAEATEDR